MRTQEVVGATVEAEIGGRPSEAAIETAAASQPSHNNNLNLIRLALAVAVIFHHSFHLVGGRDPLSAAMLTQRDSHGASVITIGHVAVDFFFVLSGWLITASWQRSPHWRDYLLKRALRIYPGFIVAVALGAFVVAPLGSTDLQATLSDLRAHWPSVFKSLGLGDYSPPSFQSNALPNSVNGSLWSVGYEFRCYLIVALVGLVLSRLVQWPKLRRAAPAALFAVAFVLYALDAAGVWTNLPGIPPSIESKVFVNLSYWPRMLVYFAAGACLYVYRDQIHLTRRACVFSMAVILAAALWVPVLPYALPIFGSYALLAIGFDRGLPLPKISSGYDISYGTYLYGWPVQQLLVKYCGGALNGYTLFVFSTAGALILGACSWFAIEQPALRLKPRPLPVD